MKGKKRIAVIDYDNCNFEKCGNYLCEKVCPVNRTGKECITYNNGEKPIISEELCIGCEICQNRCPFNAISIVNINIDLDEPIHSFGKNHFRLHGLPIPKENNTIGLIGRNGIGKTTILKILSGEIIQNFGEKKGIRDKVIEYYRGKEAQTYFEELYAGSEVAIKPQNVEAIKATGKVIDLLKKVDDENRLDSVVGELALEKILDRNAVDLSGGEFQKVAIAATGLKKAKLYFFDEPTSFLDIKERLRVAKFIRNLAVHASVLVVEHDLILLDYLSDFVHLMYGKPRVYGFVSQIKTTREGINDYLEGHSREENYRFRDYKIDFFSKAEINTEKGFEKMIEWPNLETKLGDFSLEIEQKEINKNEVVGIVGPNGIGKTTFMKILAGEIKPDKGKIQTKVKVSYKPQYISYTGEKTVSELFINVNLEEIKNSLLKPLELEGLMEKKAKTLSGGEMQRLSIALCLSKDADVYLLDEPSAYLDVEQRLVVGKTIRNHIDVRDCSSIIIDHDLTFIDYVSDKIMVFKGEPSIKGNATGPYDVTTGMNNLLEYLDITVRRDNETKRPRINKKDSVLDREQKKNGKYYK
ncbi:MAG: ribosome biogenesis/translation initiation ATPase RLI [Candidatus Diapherotrites archaeon]|nr:ribosome biogenesis/translation initiation ATPase RLI [Candidatus Diapherotrites archaeon]